MGLDIIESLNNLLENKNDIELNNNLMELSNEVTIETQNNFLDTAIGKAVNLGLDIGLRAILPDTIENSIIDIKDAIIKNGFEDGINTAIQSAIDLGKSALGIITGNFESISQAHTAVKRGGILDSISQVLDNVFKSVSKTNSLPQTVIDLLKKGKNVIFNNMTNQVEETFLKQVEATEKLGKYINNWNNYYSKEDLDGMKREYQKIKEELKQLMPIENTIKEARKIENIQKLIQSKNGEFDLTEDEIELINRL